MLLLLLLNIVLLVLAGWAMSRMLAAARVRAGQQQMAMLSAAAAPMPVTPVLPAYVPGPSFRSYSGIEVPRAPDVYADPIDGVRFAPGEAVRACECGVGYRMESVEWLEQYFEGRCVECGAEVAAPASIRVAA